MKKDSRCHQHMRFFIKGFLGMFILSETSKRATSGKEIMDSIREFTRGEWDPSPGATYPILRRMEGEGLISSKLAPGKGRRSILYSATPKGRKRLVQFRDHMIEKSSRAIMFMLPLMMRVTHWGIDEENAAKAMELSRLFAEERNRLLTLPDRRLGPELDRMLWAIKKVRKLR